MFGRSQTRKWCCNWLLLPVPVLCAVVVFQPIVARGDDDAIKYATLDCQQHLDSARDTMTSLESTYGIYGDFTSADLVRVDRDYRVTAAAWEQALTAYQKGDSAKGSELRTAASKASPPIDWPRRLQYRLRMYYLDVNDRSVLSYASWSTPQAIPALATWVRVRKKCCLAWGRAAESMTDDTDATRPTPAAEVQAIEVAKAADIEEETTRWDYEFAKTLYNDLLRDKDLTSPELTNAVAALTQVQKQRVSLRLEDIDRQRRSREYERQLLQLTQEVQKASAAASQAREDAKARAQAAQNKH